MFIDYSALRSTKPAAEPAPEARYREEYARAARKTRKVRGPAHEPINHELLRANWMVRAGRFIRFA